MSRFAIDPRWLVYLPPTMSPVATFAPARPARAPGRRRSRTYRRDGVDQVVCEEKHMGSRAVALVCRTAGRGASAGSACRTASRARCGRGPGGPFFARRADRGAGRPAAGAPPSGRAVRRAGHVLAAARRRADAVERQGRAAAARPVRGGRRGRPRRRCRPRWRALEQAAAAGLDVGDAAGPHAGAGSATRPRSRPPTGGTAGRPTGWPACGSRRSRCWPPRGRRTRSGRTPGTWTLADRLAAADAGAGRGHPPDRRGHHGPGLGRRRRRDWWAELTGGGGEGMVVKPAAEPDPRAQGARRSRA